MFMLCLVLIYIPILHCVTEEHNFSPVLCTIPKELVLPMSKHGMVLNITEAGSTNEMFAS
jgi:hypothetical protein